MINDALDLLGHRNRWAVATAGISLMGFSALAFATLVAEAWGYADLRIPTETMACAFGPFIGLFLINKVSQTDRPRFFISSVLIYFVVLSVFIAPRILTLIAEKTPQLTWTHVLSTTDITWLAGPIMGALALICLAKIVSNNDEGFTRARGAALGDARWLDMREVSTLFPPDGEVVIGEAYRPDQERTGHDAFDPGNKRTWGGGGRGPLLTYKLNFDSTHMLFFAGSGGFKTTSTVVPTALRYGGSMVVLDPAREVGQLVGPLRSKMSAGRFDARGKSFLRTAVMLDPTIGKVQGCVA